MAAAGLKHLIQAIADPDRRRAYLAARRSYREFAREFGPVFSASLADGGTPGRRVLVVSIGSLEAITVELALIKALELAGFRAVVLMNRDRRCTPYYRLAGVRAFVHWDEVLPETDAAAANRLLDDARSFDEFIALRDGDVRIGKYAASTAMRQLRVGAIEVDSPEMRRQLLPHVAASLAYATASRRLVATVRPDLVLSMDPGYTPRGELFDACLAARIDTITWNAAHKNNTLMLKRYGPANCDVHPASLSDGTWRRLREEPWTDERRRSVREELFRAYSSGEWYSEVGTQFNTSVIAPDEVRRRLALDPGKKTVVIFPHIFWDGTFFWGTDLFGSYEEWFVETIRAAVANPRVNWIVKVHPAHTVKNARDGVSGESGEATAIRTHLGGCPSHFRLIPPDSDINTYSLFGVMDACVTVRGTVGIEAATFGIPVLTAGSGRYDRRGFTIDSTSREEYLSRLAAIENVGQLAAPEHELAERYAYGLFVRRPLRLTTALLEYQKDAKASVRTRVTARTAGELRRAPDLNAFSRWVASGAEDFDAAAVDACEVVA